MKCFSMPLSLVLAALTLLAASTPAHAGERPIQAEGRGFLSTYNERSPQLVGWGKGNHLGRCGLISYLNWGELNDNRNLDAVYFEIEAANGDRVFASVHSEFDRTTGVLTLTITFVGGTGRFTDAAGSAHLVIVPDTYWLDEYGSTIDATRFSWALEGTINY